MRAINCHVLALFALILVTQCYWASSAIYPYIYAPYTIFGQEESALAAFAKLNIKENSDPSATMAKVRQLAGSNDKHQKFYKTILMMVDHHTVEGAGPLISLWKQIDATPRLGGASAEIVEKFGFLKKHFGKTKMNELAALVEEKYSQIQTLNVLDSFDLVFRAALNEKNEIGDTDEAYLAWCDRLQKFNLDVDDMKVSEMFGVIEMNWPDIAQVSDDRMDMFENFMDNKCRELSKFSPELDIVHLAKDVTAIKSVMVRRLSEYRRFCVAWITPGRYEAIVRNVRKQMTVDGRIDRKTGWKDKYRSALAYFDHKKDKILEALVEEESSPLYREMALRRFEEN